MPRRVCSRLRGGVPVPGAEADVCVCVCVRKTVIWCRMNGPSGLSRPARRRPALVDWLTSPPPAYSETALKGGKPNGAPVAAGAPDCAKTDVSAPIRLLCFSNDADGENVHRWRLTRSYRQLLAPPLQQFDRVGLHWAHRANNGGRRMAA